MQRKSKVENDRIRRDAFYKTDSRSPISKFDKFRFSGLSYFEYDESACFELNLHEFENKKNVEISDNFGGVQTYIAWGEFRFNYKGTDLRLIAYKNRKASEHLWIPFKDKTNGVETYGAGRYLDLGDSCRVGELWILDLNTAYNPSCAYNENFVCPYVPQENHLEVELRVGERKYHV